MTPAYLRFRWTLMRLGWQDARRRRAFLREFARIARLPDEPQRITEVRSLAERDSAAQGAMEVARLGAMTRYLIARGNRLMLPYPPSNDERYWRQRADHGLYLTREGVARYREQIEAHEKAQREARAFYLNTATGLVGAFAALAGLVVAWLSLRR